MGYRFVLDKNTNKLQLMLDNTVFNIQSSVSTHVSLPTNGNSQYDIRITTDTQDAYFWSIIASSGNLNNWVKITALIGLNAIEIGDGEDTDKYLYVFNGDANKPNIRYNSATNTWQYSNDGVSWNDIGTGGGGVGDMTKVVYDADNDGIVDEAETLNDGTSGDVNKSTAIEVRNHLDSIVNPHSVTLSQLGLDTLDDVADGITYGKVKLSELASGLVAYVDDGTSGNANRSTAAEIKDAVNKKHDRLHGIDDTNDHNGVLGATENNFVSFDANGLPKDSGSKVSDFETSGAVTTHEGTYDHTKIHNQNTDTILLTGASGGTQLIASSVLKNNLSVDNLITIDGRDLSVDGTKLDGIEASAVALATVKADADITSAINHVSNDGSDHSFIDQDVTSGSSPTFDVTNFSGTFAVFPLTPSEAPDADYEVANKKYVDDTVGGISGATPALDNLASVAINTTLVSDENNIDDLGTTDIKWKDLYLAGNLSDGTNVVTIANLKTAYDHSQDNTQAHSDYLLNSGNDETSGTIIATGFHLADGNKVTLGTGSDGEIYSSSDDIYIKNVTQNKDIIFNVNDGGVEKEIMRIDSSEFRIGIGTSNPFGLLTINSLNSVYPTLSVHQTNTSSTSPTLDVINYGDGNCVEVFQYPTNPLASGKHLLSFYSENDITTADTALVKFWQAGVNMTEPVFELINLGLGNTIEDDTGACLTTAGVWTDAVSLFCTKVDIKDAIISNYIEKIKNLKLYNYQKKVEVYGKKQEVLDEKDYIRALDFEHTPDKIVNGIKYRLKGRKYHKIIGTEYSKEKRNPNARRYSGIVLDDPSTPEELISRDKDGNINGIPLSDGINFLLGVCKEQQKLIDNLQNEINLLKSKI